jgi:Fe-S cluster assembly protein SufD
MKSKYVVQKISEDFSGLYKITQNTKTVYVFVVEAKQNIDVYLDFELRVPGADIDILGIVKGENQTIQFRTLQHHIAPQTTSNLLIKTVQNGNGSFLYNGIIRVEKEAQKTDAYQRNENLLLSHTAHAESKPELEIMANDVRCTHGATIGNVQEDLLWYLASRGIPYQKGIDLISQGFLRSVVDKIQDPTMRNEIAALGGF